MADIGRRDLVTGLAATSLTLPTFAASAQAAGQELLPGLLEETTGNVVIRPAGRPAAGGDDSALFHAAFDHLSSHRVSPPGLAGWGLGSIQSPRGRYRFRSLTPSQSAIGFSWSGEGRFATSNEFEITSGHALRLGPYIGVAIEEMSFINTAPRPGDSTCFLLSGNGGGTLLTLRNVWVEGFRYAVRIEGATNGDTTLIQQCSFVTPVGFTPGSSTQAIIHLMLNCTSNCTEALFQTAGGSEMTISSHNGTVSNAFLQFLDGSGSPQTGRTRIVNSKLEYHDPRGAQLLVDARQKSRAQEGGNAIYWRDSTLAGGLGVPANPDGHEVIHIGNDSFKLDFEGGYLRGRITYNSSYSDASTIGSFRYMEAAPLPEAAAFRGEGTHPLIEWRGNQNVPVDQYRGGQSGIRSFDAQKALLWRPPVGADPASRYVLDTRAAAHANRLEGRWGADFTLAALPPNTHLFGVGLFIQDASPGDTHVGLFADASFRTPLAPVTVIPSGARGLRRLAGEERILPDGRVFVRLTRAGRGEVVEGAVVLFYFPYFGA